jgi:phosphoenolpyruvate carboxykinase (diphosphate)
MSSEERSPAFLIENGFLERCEDFDHEGRRILAGRLGYRINERFVHAFFGRVFNHPSAVFTTAMLRPELQDLAIFVDGIDNVVGTQKRVAKMYFDDGSINQACPPLRALLHIMLEDVWEGKGLDHPEVRSLFTLKALLSSDWYQARLKAKQQLDIALWRRHVDYLSRFLKKPSYSEEAIRLGISSRLEQAQKALKEAQSSDYISRLSGTLGAQPIEAFTS